MRAIRKRYLPRSAPLSFDHFVNAACAATTALSTSLLSPDAICESTSSVAGFIVAKCFLPFTNLPLMKWPYSFSIFTIDLDSGAGAYSKVMN